MVTLAIEGSGGSELTYQLTKKVISIGASSQNDVVIRSPGVAPHHLVIQHNGTVFTFLGQNRQVVVLNGERRSRGVLRVGDRIRVGTATIVFKGGGESEPEVTMVEEEGGPEMAPVVAASASTQNDGPSSSRGRSELVLYSEPSRRAQARRKMVEMFRAGVRTDLGPSLRSFLAELFPERQAMLARLDDEGRFEPLVSQWTGDLPRLPKRTFDELSGGGRYAELHLTGNTYLIYPVERGSLEGQAYLLAQTMPETEDEDHRMVGELSRMLSVHWDRVERSSVLLGTWEADARSAVETTLPGTSHAIRVLRDAVIEAAKTPQPILICGRSGVGRMTVASLLAALHARGAQNLQVLQARDDDDAFRFEFFGPEGSEGGARERAVGGMLVLRDIHLVSPALQREVADAIGLDLSSGFGPSVRWVATTDDDPMRLLNDGMLEPALFNVFQRHVIRVPSIQDRREDLPLLVVKMLEDVGAEQGKIIRGIELETLNCLLAYSFDGEMAELLAELRRLVSATPSGEMVRGPVPAQRLAVNIGEGEDPTASATALLSLDDLKVVIPAVERLVIDRVLQRTLGNQSKAARVLNLSRGALIAKMKEYEIPDYRYLRRRR
jgi:DNA-binding NtrC family response regulator/pSer/pThr/pTyr-binding forkhead associated (FHA) protein